MGIATEKQINFLRSLASERVTDAKQDDMLARIFAGTRPTTSQEASLFITMLLDAPRKPRPASAAKPSPYAAALAALTDVPVSFYAIPAGYVAAQQIDLNGNDYLFVRVRNMSRGGKRMSRVVGSPEAPRYMHMSPAVVEHVANK